MISSSGNKSLKIGYKQTMKALANKCEKVYVAEDSEDRIRQAVEKAAAMLGEKTAQALEIPDVLGQGLVPGVHEAPKSATPDQLLSQLSLTIPLEIDGYRLGVAAIEGINRVNSATGRVELSM